MKKLYVYATTALIVSMCAMPLAAFAQDQQNGADVSGQATVDANVQMQATGQTDNPSHPGFFQNIIQTIRTGIRGDRNQIREQRASTTADIQQMMQERQQTGSTTPGLRREIHDIMASTSAEIRGERQDIHGDQKMEQMAHNARTVVLRINATIIRLQKILDKLNTRIAKIKATGADTSGAETDSANAKTALTAAGNDLSQMKTIAASFASSTQVSATATSTDVSTLKSLASDAQSQLKTARTDIQQALTSLAALHVNLEASTTVEASH